MNSSYLPQWVEAYTSNLYSWAFHKVSNTEFAKGCGALGLRVEQKNELEEKMQKVIKHEGTALLEIKTDVNLV